MKLFNSIFNYRSLTAVCLIYTNQLSLAQATPAPTTGVAPSPISSPVSAAALINKQSIYKSIVKIEVATQKSDYKTPWNSGRFAGGTGTGFLIGKNRFLTNAHVVSNHKRIYITMHGSARKHQASVLHIAHDCDLAILEVADFTPFEKLAHLEIGNIPKLESEVRVIGYPVGGDRISVTRGVVSRIDFRTYAHSRADQHLVVQIDAAINPGNSGGPVLQNGKVVGVAFQGLTSADNTGYMIPTPVVKRFLTDIEDGEYNHYMSLGISEFPMFNPAMRKVYNLKNDEPGVLVARVIADTPAAEALKEGDLLTAIDGHAVDSSGSVMIEGERVDMNEIVERKFEGDKVQLEYVRDEKKTSASVTLKHFPAVLLQTIQYGKRPRYTIQGGLVFQPLTINLYTSANLNNPRLRRIFARYTSENIFKEREDIVVLTRVLNDPVNEKLSGYSGNAVESINGVKIKNLQQAHELLNPKELPEFFDIRLDGITRPLILPGKNIGEINQRIQKTYGINNPSFLVK